MRNIYFYFIILGSLAAVPAFAQNEALSFEIETGIDLGSGLFHTPTMSLDEFAVFLSDPDIKEKLIASDVESLLLGDKFHYGNAMNDQTVHFIEEGSSRQELINFLLGLNPLSENTKEERELNKLQAIFEANTGVELGDSIFTKPGPQIINARRLIRLTTNVLQNKINPEVQKIYPRHFFGNMNANEIIDGEAHISVEGEFSDESILEILRAD